MMPLQKMPKRLPWMVERSHKPSLENFKNKNRDKDMSLPTNEK
jgi:hypothetical protein